MDQNAEKDTKIKTDNCFYLCLICLMTQAAGRAHLSTVVMFVVRCISSKDRGVWPTLSWVSSRSKNNCRAILVSYYTFWNYFTFLFLSWFYLFFFWVKIVHETYKRKLCGRKGSSAMSVSASVLLHSFSRTVKARNGWRNKPLGKNPVYRSKKIDYRVRKKKRTSEFESRKFAVWLLHVYFSYGHRG